MFLHITHAEYTSGHRIQVAFNDGTRSEIDLSSSLNGPIFEPLRDVEYFKSFALIGHTLAWPNGADFAPEFLYQKLCPDYALKPIPKSGAA
jgi:hypothetical protein